jgi:hypothetical protein
MTEPRKLALHTLLHVEQPLLHRCKRAQVASDSYDAAAGSDLHC